MKPVRLLFVLLAVLTTQIPTRAVPSLTFSETWQDTWTNTAPPTVITNGTTSIVFSGLVANGPVHVDFSTLFILNIEAFSTFCPLSGDTSDPDNPVLSSYVPGATSATVTFYHRSATGAFIGSKKVKINWANNILSGSLTGVSGSVGFESLVHDPSYRPVGETSAAVFFGSFVKGFTVFFRQTNSVTGAPDGKSLNKGGITGQTDAIAPMITITSPAEGFSTTNPLVNIRGTCADNLALWLPLWRWGSATDDPTRGRYEFNDWTVADHFDTNFPKTDHWSTTVDMSATPGTNWFWVSEQDGALNAAKIVTRKIFYSVRSPLVLGAKGHGSIIGGKGVTNGAMLEIGRGYPVTAHPLDSNTIFRDWRDSDGKVLSTQNPYSFLMKPNMVLGAFFPTSPFPAMAGTYSGIFYDGVAGISTSNSGYALVMVKSNGNFNGTILFGAQRLPIAGKLQYDIDAADPDALNGLFTVAGATVPLSGVIRFPTDSGGNYTSMPTLAMTASDHAQAPVPLARSGNVVPVGLYTMCDTYANQSTPPTNSIGNSYGSVTVTSNGQANVILHLPDGSAPVATFSSPVGVDGSVSFFIPLYGGKGLVTGTVNLSGGIVGSQGSDNYWVKLPNARDHYYPDGFIKPMSFVGSAYSPAVVTQELIDSALMQFDIRYKSYNVNVIAIYVPTNHTFVLETSHPGDVCNVKFNPATGLVSGSLTVNGTNVPNINVQFAQPSYILGYALGASNSATVVLDAPIVTTLGNYDDGFVLLDAFNGNIFGFPATGYIGYTDPTQIVGPVATPAGVTMHKAIQIAPHQQFVITDIFTSIYTYEFRHFSQLQPPPYTGTFIPTLPPFPALWLFPARTTEYRSN